MTAPGAAQLEDVIEATWPAHACRRVGPWVIRDGRGGGKRVSAATAHGPATRTDLPAAEEAMRALGTRARFRLRGGEDALDAMLAEAGYDVFDPVNIHVIALGDLALEPPARTASFHLWEPLAIQAEIWAKGGIGPARVDVMHRARLPKTALLGRDSGHAAAAGFVAISGTPRWCTRWRCWKLTAGAAWPAP